MSGERMKEGKRRRREGKRGEDSVHVREEKEVEGENGMEGLTLIFSLSLSLLYLNISNCRERERASGTSQPFLFSFYPFPFFVSFSFLQRFSWGLDGTQGTEKKEKTRREIQCTERKDEMRVNE